MPLIWVAIQTFIFSVAGPLIVHILVAMGIGFVTYSGADLVIGEGETFILDTFGELPADLYSIMVIAGVDEGIKILTAAASAFISIKVTMGAFSRMKLKPDSFRA